MNTNAGTVEITVLIPTRNPHSGRLARTLAALARQTLPSDKWELLLIDNGSTPPLEPALLRSIPAAARIVREEKIGATAARLTGIAESVGGLLVMVDDDNELAPDYLRTVRDFFALNPTIGAAGGRIIGEFEIRPPRWAQDHLHQLALRDFGDEVKRSETEPDGPKEYPWFAPFGAGMAIRKECAVRYLRLCRESGRYFNCRAGNRLGGCGDTELIIEGVLKHRQGVAYIPDLRLTHLIPASRLQFRYLSRLAFSCGIDWGRLSTSSGYAKPLTWIGAGLRAARTFFRCRPWTRSGWLHMCAKIGFIHGRATWKQRA